MAATLTLASTSPNRLIYKLVHTGAEASNVPNAGGASPDLSTDALGPIKQIATARTNGYGAIPAGALTQAQARALLLSDGASARAECIVTVSGRAGGAAWDIDANVDGEGDPILTATSSAAGTCYIKIEFPAAIG